MTVELAKPVYSWIMEKIDKNEYWNNRSFSTCISFYL